MTVATRFAISPTGRLHVGGARRALVNWLFARANGGRCILRIDDIGAEPPAGVAAWEADLAWLGLPFDERHRQSDRLAHYELAFRTLRQAGRVYACDETPDEPAAGADAGPRTRWRFALEEREVAWDDLILGGSVFQGGRLEDPVVRHADGCPSVLFASAVDDVELGITHLIRNEDELSHTALEIQIMQAMGGFLPQFAHLPRLIDAKGEELAEDDGMSLEDLRERGIEPQALCSVLAALGTPASPRSAARLEDLARGFALPALGEAPPRFDLESLERFGRR
jgi:glutamyl-tRNA synthetase